MPHKDPERVAAYQKRYAKANAATKAKNAAAWRAKNPDRAREGVRTSVAKAGGHATYELTRRLRTFGVSRDEYDELYIFGCRICREPFGETVTTWPCFDHDHQTQEFRGLLCSRCNTGLGMYRDNPTLLRLAAYYLEGAH